MRLIGYIFHQITDFFPHLLWQIDSMALLQDVIDAAFPGLAVDADNIRIIFSSHILGINRQIRNRPGTALLLLSPGHALADGILMRTGERRKYKISRIGLTVIHLHPRQTLIGFTDMFHIREIQPRIYAMRIQIHRQCDDIGTVKLPNWLKEHTGKALNFEFTNGTEFPSELNKYRLIVHCGGCTLNEREIKYRMKCAQDSGIPMTNYGTVIAYMNGILERSLEIFHTLL